MTLVALVIALVIAASSAASGQVPCPPTPADMEGPFYKPNAPARESTGRGFVVSGVVRSAATCQPIPGARVEWWQANREGQYDDAHRGAQVAGEAGAYRFETDFPPPYSGRPSHVHVKARAAGHRTLTTQLYPRAGQSQATFDLVLVKE